MTETTAMNEPTQLTVEIWSDVVCPWCFIGKRRWEEGLAAFNAKHPDVVVDVAYRAFQLDPTAPIGESQPVVQAYEKKFGGPAQAKQIIDNVTAEAAKAGLDFRMDIALRSNTADAHRLLVLAEREGVQLELKERLMLAYFSQGEDIGLIDSLVAFGAEVGLDPEVSRGWLQGDGGRREVADQLVFAADAGIHSVPTFVIDRSIGVPGAQPAEVFIEILEQAVAQQA